MSNPAPLSIVEPLLTLHLESGATLLVAPLATPQNIDPTEEKLCAKRQKERYTWHTLARQILQQPTAQFEYNTLGAPCIVASNLHISVSHSTTLVAVIIGPTRCAIDIEALERNFERVAPRYIDPTEQSLCTHKTSLAQLWSIKECLYKYCGTQPLDMVKDVRVLTLESENFSASLPTHPNPIGGKVIIAHNHIVAYIG
ncbi:MAG: 4'-phosphopantetheinyl transferase superfamily protein [Rikenellaceae bacterium]